MPDVDALNANACPGVFRPWPCTLKTRHGLTMLAWQCVAPPHQSFRTSNHDHTHTPTCSKSQHAQDQR
eukprot:15484703-Alexandrium_andersonii.AAC.1